MTAEHTWILGIQKSATFHFESRPLRRSRKALPAGPVARAWVPVMVGLLLALAPAPTTSAALPEEVGVEAREAIPQGLVRLHVIAHSDHPEDQALKLRVRDALLERYGGELLALADEPAVSAWAERRREAVERLAQEVLAAQGARYGAQLVAGWAHFPETRLDGTPYPAGRYLAVRLILGEGAGQNWWCVLFPPLCLVDEAQVTELEARPADAVVPVWMPAGGDAPTRLPVGIEWRSYLLDAPLGEEGSWPLRWADAQQMVAGAARLVSPPVHAQGEPEDGEGVPAP